MEGLVDTVDSFWVLGACRQQHGDVIAVRSALEAGVLYGESPGYSLRVNPGGRTGVYTVFMMRSSVGMR